MTLLSSLQARLFSLEEGIIARGENAPENMGSVVFFTSYRTYSKFLIHTPKCVLIIIQVTVFTETF